jgi:hypothetical protein
MVERLDSRAEIEEAVQELGLLPSDFRALGVYEYENILISIIDRFTTLGRKGVNEIWLWNSFKEPRSSMQLDYPTAVLREFVPLEETVWFVAEDWNRHKRHGNYWLYEGKITAIVDLLGEMHGFEYYVVSKKFEWLLCENHHGILMAVGQFMVEKLERLKENYRSTS